jgi:hypothetical protein
MKHLKDQEIEVEWEKDNYCCMDIISWSKGGDSRPPQIGGPGQKVVRPRERKNITSSKSVQIYKIFFSHKGLCKVGVGQKGWGGGDHFF